MDQSGLSPHESGLELMAKPPVASWSFAKKQADETVSWLAVQHQTGVRHASSKIPERQTP